MASRSSGFTVCMSITRAEMPSASSVSAARMAWATSRPLAMMVDVGALRHLDGLADFELLVGAVNDGRLGPAGANEYRAHVRRGRADQRLGGGLIGRRDHHETRQRTGQRGLFHAHLRGAVFADRDAAVRPHHLEVDLGIRRADAELLEALVHHEGRETGDERDLSRQRQPGADRPPCWPRRCRRRRTGRETPWRNRWSWWTWKDPRRRPRCPCSRGPAPPACARRLRAWPAPSFTSNLVLTGMVIEAPVGPVRLPPAWAPCRGTWGCSP